MNTSVQSFRNRANGVSDGSELPFYVLALNTSAKASHELEKVLVTFSGLAKVRPAVGCFEGERERSYVIIPLPGKRASVAHKVFNLAIEHKQKCVLCVYGAGKEGLRPASLIWTNIGTTQPIGFWEEAPAYLAGHLPDWTLVGNQLYIVSK